MDCGFTERARSHGTYNEKSKGVGNFIYYVQKSLPSTRLCSNGARSPEATNIWPRATENIFLVARPGDLLVLVS